MYFQRAVDNDALWITLLRYVKRTEWNLAFRVIRTVNTLKVKIHDNVIDLKTGKSKRMKTSQYRRPGKQI